MCFADPGSVAGHPAGAHLRASSTKSWGGEVPRIARDAVRGAARRGGAPRSLPRGRRGGTLPPGAGAGPGRHGRGVPGRAGRRPVRAAGRPQADQARHGLGRDPRAASSPSGRSSPGSTTPTSRGCSTAGSPPTASPGSPWSTWTGAPLSLATATQRRLGVARAAAALPGRVRRGAVRPPQPGGAPRPQALEHPGDRRRAR